MLYLKNIVKTKIKEFYAKNKATVGDPSTLVKKIISTIPLSAKNLLPKRKSMVDYVNKSQNQRTHIPQIQRSTGRLHPNARGIQFYFSLRRTGRTG